MVEIKAFVQVSNDVNKVEKGAGCTYPIACKHGFCLISAPPFRCVIGLSLTFTHFCRIKGCGGAGWPPHQ